MPGCTFHQLNLLQWSPFLILLRSQWATVFAISLNCPFSSTSSKGFWLYKSLVIVLFSVHLALISSLQVVHELKFLHNKMLDIFPVRTMTDIIIWNYGIINRDKAEMIQKFLFEIKKYKQCVHYTRKLSILFLNLSISGLYFRTIEMPQRFSYFKFVIYNLKHIKII